MILVGNRRGGAAELAIHLMNVEDNEHVMVHDLRGFIADDLDGAFHEVNGISRGTRCKKFLYSLSLNPPSDETVPVEVFEAAIERIEKELGFTGQPRAIVFHEKQGPQGYRRHAHVVWSRINSATMAAIDPYQDKLSLNNIGRELFMEYGWMMPDGYERKEDSDPLNYSHAEHRQAKRAKRDPKQVKQLFAESWERSDSKASFASALKEYGFILAKGDRRAFVAVDAQGEVYSVSRWAGVKAKEVRARLVSFDDLPNIVDAIKQFDPANHEIVSHPSPTNTSQNSPADIDRLQNLGHAQEKLRFLVAEHREARSRLEQFHEARRISEIKDRSSRLPIGIKGVWLKLSGGYEALQKELETEARLCAARDRTEYQALIEKQLLERRKLQGELQAVQAETDPASEFLQTDPAQKLIIPPDGDAFTNKARIERDPAYILNVITDKQETFTRPAIVRALAQYIDDPLKLGLSVDIAMRSDELVEMEASPVPVYSTREMLASKQAILSCAEQLFLSNGPAVSASYINAAIKHQNNALQGAIGASLSEQQETAIRHCLKPHRISAVIGLAGAGKSTMLSAVRQAYQRQGVRVVGAALSGKAADGLESSSGIESRTLASLEQSWKKGYNQLTKNDVLVIDEAGMIGTRQLNRFIKEVERTGAKVILVGDPEQLQPINAGTPFREVAETIGAVHLTEIHRQTENWQKQASLDLAEQRTAQALNAYEVRGNVKQARDNAGAILDLVTDYMKDLTTNGDNKSRLALAYRRKDVFAINQAIRAARQEFGHLADEVLVSTKHGPRAFAINDRILLTRNDHTLGIRNGMIGTVKSVSEDRLEILLDANGGKYRRKITINPKLYNFLDHGYATTIHKSQGATVDHTYLLGSPLLDRHLTYVAMTRHKEDVHLYGDHNSLQKMRSYEGQSADKYNRQEPQRKHLHRRNRGPTMH